MKDVYCLITNGKLVVETYEGEPLHIVTGIESSEWGYWLIDKFSERYNIVEIFS